jgi:GntR family histidine utilization transcriptional repressor
LASATADLATATELELAPGATAFHSVIVHCENERPIQVENRYIRAEFAVDYLSQDFTCRTPYDYLMSLGPLEEVEHVIQALIPDETTRALLAMPEGEPVLHLRRRTWSGGAVVTSARLVHPGSGYSMVGRFRVGGKMSGASVR